MKIRFAVSDTGGIDGPLTGLMLIVEETSLSDEEDERQL
jgi:hypothetical protein